MALATLRLAFAGATQDGQQETVPDGDWSTAADSVQYTVGEVVPWARPNCTVERRDGTKYEQQGVAYAVFGNGGVEDNGEPTYMTVRFTALASDLEIAGQNVAAGIGLDEVNSAQAQVNKVTYEAESDVKIQPPGHHEMKAAAGAENA